MHTLEQAYKVFQGLTLQDITSATTTNGGSIDCLEHNHDCVAVVQRGAMTGTHTDNVKIQESDATGSGFADISGAAFAEADEGDDDTVAVLQFKRTKRFIRMVSVTLGTVTVNEIAGSILVEAAKQGTDVNSSTAAA